MKRFREYLGIVLEGYQPGDCDDSAGGFLHLSGCVSRFLETLDEYRFVRHPEITSRFPAHARDPFRPYSPVAAGLKRVQLRVETAASQQSGVVPDLRDPAGLGLERAAQEGSA
ncbi:hypothetical protein [Streptomyces phaeochromogenes]|uniref:hypothetical protein n=1 Tax=Streptomyces phaeochromogenes TaxID=1923 RepID=UPI0027D8F536|nr:hypothetical protein [Streptomyces phaeochromogenes]